MHALFTRSEPFANASLRFALAAVLFWIGALKFVDPSPVVGLLGASLPFLASAGIVYLLGVAEVACALLLVANVQVKWVGLAVMGLFVGTLTIFLIAPKVTYGDAGFPLLSLVGEFLLKDLVLFFAAFAVAARAWAAAAKPAEAELPRSIQHRAA